MITKTRQFLFYWLPIIIYCLAIYIQSSRPAPMQMPDIPLLDKLLHFTAYAVLGALFLRAFRTVRIRNNIKLAMALSVFLSTFYGLSDELHQHFVPYRNADLMDALADMLGSICGVVIYQKLMAKGSPLLIKFLN